MTAQIKRPILIGGIGLSLTLALVESIQHSVTEVGETALLGIIALSTWVWLFGKQQKQVELTTGYQAPTNEKVEKAIAHSNATIEQLTTEARANSKQQLTTRISQLKNSATQLPQETQRQELHLNLTGSKSSGKSTIAELLKSNWLPAAPRKVELTETPAIETATAPPCDLTLFVTTGDLTEPEYKTLASQTSKGQRVILIWNKKDRYLPEQQPQIFQKLRERVASILPPENVVAVAASPNPIKVRRHQPDGTVEESLETSNPEISALTERLTKILEKESQQLVWATTIQKAEAVKLEGKTLLNQIRRERAMPIIEQYQWIAATAAFANPFPALDLLATAAVNAQLIVDLGAIYQQKFSLEQGKQVAGSMANLMLKLGLVELSTKTLTAILKSHAATFVAGGVVQGTSAAYLTRIAGLTLLEYLQSQEVAINANRSSLNSDSLSKILETVFQQNQQISYLQSFVKQTLGRILPQSQQQKVEIVNG
jgi:GTPase SAR1 family protein